MQARLRMSTSASTNSNQDLETPCIYGALGSVQVVVRDNVRNLAINLPFFVPFPLHFHVRQ